MYQRLKERCLRQARKDLVTDPRNQRVLFIAGRRRSESGRRSGFRKGKLAVPLDEREGSTVWASPIAMWLKEDLVTYRAMMKQQGDPVPFNPVTDHLGMSGECLCGSFATDGELERIRFWYPDFAAEIDALSKEVATCWQEPHCRWGHGIGGTSRRMGRLCSSCQ
jgi:3'-phosphoadenosine 5'-phosphosulfate sulfotransferase (PAPS reductase)/FAD synthetase